MCIRDSPLSAVNESITENILYKRQQLINEKCYKSTLCPYCLLYFILPIIFCDCKFLLQGRLQLFELLEISIFEIFNNSTSFSLKYL